MTIMQSGSMRFFFSFVKIVFLALFEYKNPFLINVHGVFTFFIYNLTELFKETFSSAHLSLSFLVCSLNPSFSFLEKHSSSS